jgi:glutamyl-tRNA reductase
MSGGVGGRHDPPLLVVGTDHRTSPLPLRERVAYDPAAAEELLVHLLARDEIAEALLLSTCNRTEIYALPREEEPGYRLVRERAFLSRAPELESAGRLYVKRGGEAARHLLRVAAGLESMVLGEPEVLGQVKQAAALADAVGSSGAVIRRLAAGAASAGARARAETAIAAGAVSLGYAVVELARNIFTALDRTRVLILGAGETARLTARALLDRGALEVRVANRTAERTRALREELPAVAEVAWGDLLPSMAAADVVIATTAAPEPVLTAAALREAIGRRPGRPLLVVDLGVPRNVEADVTRLESVFLHSLDSLESLIDRNLRRRREEVPAVEELVERELDRFRAWYRTLEAEPLVARLQKQAERIRAEELARTLSDLPPETHEAVDRLTRALVRKILHHPSARLRGKEGAEDLPRLDLVRELFRLDDDEG